MHRKSSKYPPELMRRAVAMVARARSSFATERDAINAVAGILGIENPDIVSKWVRVARRGSQPDGEGSPRLQALKKYVLRSHVVVIGVVVTVLGGLGLAYSQQVFGVSQPSTTRSAPNLEVDEVSLTAQGWTFLPGGIDDPNPFRIDIKLLNTGNQIVAINSAELVIQKEVVLPQCTGQSGFFPTGSYSVNVPTDPTEGAVVDVPVSQLVPADGADRFDILLRSRMPVHALGTKYVYRFHLYLTYNSTNARLDLGEIIADYPVAPDQGEYFWSKYWAANPTEFGVMTATAGGTANVKACDIRGSDALRSILSLPGAKSADLAAIQSQLAY